MDYPTKYIKFDTKSKMRLNPKKLMPDLTVVVSIQPLTFKKPIVNQ